MKIAQVNANDNLINSIAKEAKDGETGIKDISNKANNKPESACVYNQGDTLDTDAFGLFLSEEDIKGTNDEEKEEAKEQVGEKPSKEYVENVVKEEAVAIEEAVISFDEETIEELTKLEISLDEYTKETLDRAISRVVSARANNAKQLEAQVDKIKEEHRDIEEIATNQLEAKIEAELRKYGASISKNAIAQIQSALAMSKAVSDTNIATTNTLIRQKLAPTIANVYKSGYNHGVANQYYELPDSLKGQIENIISENVLGDKDYLMSVAGAMIQDNLPVTIDTLTFHLDMKAAKSEYSEAEMLSKIVGNVVMGGNPMDTLITKDGADKKLDTIEKLFVQNGEISSVSEFLAIRTLNEVRLAMTTDASIKMAVKNIDVDVAEITDTLDRLRAIEEKLYTKMFLGEDKTIGEAVEASASMCKVERSLSLVSYNREILVGTTFTSKDTILGGFENAITRYEQSATEVRKDLGDSYKKAFDSIPALLDELSLDNTERNIRAVKELSYASIEITVDNIEQMKAYDMSFDTMINNLTPSVTKKLIEEGINPLNMTVEELNAKALEIKDEFGFNDLENYAQFLYRLDKEGSITKEMRDAYIGIYRLIKNIQNTDGAAVSTAYKAGMEMTLSNLLSCVRTYKSKGVDSVVNDEFGVAQLEIKEDAGLAIDAQINKISYYNRIVDSLADKVSPQLIKEYEAQSGKLFVEENIELLENMAQSTQVTESEGYVNGGKAYSKSLLEATKEGMIDAKVNAQILHGLGLEVTVGNLIQIHNYGNTFDKRVKKVSELTDNNVVSSIPTDEELDSVFASEDALDSRINQLYDEILADIENVNERTQSPDEIMQASMMMKNISFSRKMMDRGCYEIPLSTDAGITNIRLQFAKDEENVGQASIFINDPVMGEVNVSIKLKGETQIKGFIACETRVGYDFFVRENKSLVKQLNNQNIEVTSMDLALGRKSRNYYGENTSANNEIRGGEGNRILLAVTKTTIRHIMKGIGEINENQS